MKYCSNCKVRAKVLSLAEKTDNETLKRLHLPCEYENKRVCRKCKGVKTNCKRCTCTEKKEVKPKCDVCKLKTSLLNLEKKYEREELIHLVDDLENECSCE